VAEGESADAGGTQEPASPVLLETPRMVEVERALDQIMGEGGGSKSAVDEAVARNAGKGVGTFTPRFRLLRFGHPTFSLGFRVWRVVSHKPVGCWATYAHGL
jgi:hypothetical protein